MSELSEYDSDDSEYGSDCMQQRNYQMECDEEDHRLEQDRQRQETERREQYFVIRDSAMRQFDRNTISLQASGIRTFRKMCSALQFAGEERNKDSVIFARDRPTADNGAMRVKYKKEYLVGNLQRFFRYGYLAVRGEVALDEVVRSGDPSPLHFDIEIKKVAHADLESCDIEAVLRAQVGAFGLEEGANRIEDVAREYTAIAVSPFTEKDCEAGFVIVRQHIRKMVERIIPEYPGRDWGEDMMVLTGCRHSKFSLHVVMKWIFCDSPVLAMPLVAFEIARQFVVENTKEVLRLQSGGAEWRFRVRALMLESLAEVDEGVLRFKGIDDSPFDEAIYSANHLLRAPGACKSSPGVGALAPAVGTTPRMLVEERRFDVVFPPHDADASVRLWMGHCICYRRRALTAALTNTFVLTKWFPTLAYPRERRWWAEYRRSGVVVGLDSQFDSVEECPVTLEMYLEGRTTRRQQRLLGLEERQLASTYLGELPAKELVEPDEMFRGEDGIMKSFRRFRPGEFLFHVHGGVEENTPSAKTFMGGFHCFGCNNTYGVPRTRAWEENYPFTEDETVEADGASAFLPEVVWDTYLRKKFCVISAPMGSGKTEQVVELVNKKQKERVCVISFRRYLAQQQANRFGVDCYLDLNDEEIRESDMLTICVNSMWKLGTRSYGCVILDECGLIRRHFLSTICTNVLGKVYDRFVQLIREAAFVVMLQDGVSREDVQFFTEIDNLQCDDRRHVSALWFRKPIEIHPILYTTDVTAALQNLQRCYRASFVGGVCTRPFMVFCSSVVYGEFLVGRLRGIALELEGADPDRVKFICGSTKATNEFSRDFSREPNATAASADVVVATSVLGAGFSIDCHFVAFHAFLWTGILNHGEENQLIRRLRYVWSQMPEEALRQSYLFVQKGHGGAVEYTTVLADFRVVRQLLIQSAEVGRRAPSIAVLEETQARVLTERADTRAKHDDLWIEWGGTIKSEFQEMTITDTGEEERNYLKKQWIQWARARKENIGDLVQGDVEDVGETLSQLEVASEMSLFRHAVADQKVIDLSDAFTSSAVAVRLIRRMWRLSEPEVKTTLGGNRVPSLVKRCRDLVCWLTWVYRDLNPEKVQTMWNHMEKRRYNTSNLKATAKYRLGEDLIHDMLIHLRGDGPPCPAYLKSTGITPFFTGAAIVEDSSLCEFLQRKLEPCPNDTREALEDKKYRVSCLLTFTSKHDARHAYLASLYKDENEALKLAKKLVKSLGLEVISSNKRVRVRGVRKRIQEVLIPEDVLALALALKDNFRKPLLEILPSMLGTNNLSNLDKDWVRASVRVYNEECEASERPELKITLGGDASIGVVSRRVRETNAERASGVFTGTTGEDHDREVAARTILEMQSSRVQALDEVVAQQSHQRHLARARAQSVSEESHVYDDDDDADNDDHYIGGLVILEAEES